MSYSQSFPPVPSNRINSNLIRLHDVFYVEGIITESLGVYDIEGDVTLIGKIREFPCNFGRVSGSFNCQDNKLESLVGGPSYVGEDYSVSNNSLFSLTGGPSYVGGVYRVYSNPLLSVESLSLSSHIGHLYIDTVFCSSPEVKRQRIIERLRA